MSLGLLLYLIILDEAGNNLGYYTLELCFDKIRKIAELEYIDLDKTYLVHDSTKVYEISYISAPCQGYYDPDLIHPWSGYGKYRSRRRPPPDRGSARHTLTTTWVIESGKP